MQKRLSVYMTNDRKTARWVNRLFVVLILAMLVWVGFTLQGLQGKVDAILAGIEIAPNINLEHIQTDKGAPD